MWLNDEDSSVGKTKRIVFVLLSRQSNCVSFCGLIKKTMNYFGLSQTAVPDGSLSGYWSSMDA